MDSDISTLKSKLIEKLTFSDGYLDVARKVWSNQAKAFLEGANSNFEDAIQIRTKFKMVERLKYDYDQLNVYNNDVDSGKIIYVIDPHILSSYAQFNAPESYIGFEYFENEWGKESGDIEKCNHLLYLYTAIFKSGPLCILEPGRQQLLGYLTHFHDLFKERHAKGSDYFEERITRYENFLSHLNLTVEDATSSAEKLDKIFKRLIGAASTSEIYNDLALSRLNHAIALGDFKNLRTSLKDLQVPEEKFLLFQELSRDLEKSGDVLVNIKTQLDLAFSVYRESFDLKKVNKNKNKSSLPSNKREFEIDFINRSWAYNSRNSLLEIHKVNSCLRAAGINVELRFITNSPLLFTFIKPFQKDMDVKLIHSRTYFAYSNREFYEDIRQSMDDVLSSSSGYSSLIYRDDKITMQELDNYRRYAPSLRSLRDANAFGGVNPQTISYFVDTITTSIKQLKLGAEKYNFTGLIKRVAEIQNKTADVIKYLECDVDNDKKSAALLLTETVQTIEYQDIFYNIFSDLTASGDKTKDPLILAKLVYSADNKTLKRILCLPVRGSYRYVFSIANSDILNSRKLIQLGLSDKFQVFSIDDLIKIIDKCISGQDTKKNAALINYIRAVHAASYRDWSFARHLAAKSQDLLQKALVHDPSLANNSRYHFLKAEVLYLLHLTLRGAAERNFRDRRQVRQLSKSFTELRNSAKSMRRAYELADLISASEQYSGAMSFRYALAFVGICTELLVAQKNLGEDFSAEQGHLDQNPAYKRVVESGKKNYYWELPEFEKLSLEGIWNDPERSVKLLVSALRGLVDDIDKQFSNVIDKEVNDFLFDPNLWNFRSLRTLQMLFNLDQLVQNDLISADTSDFKSSTYLSKFQNVLDDYSAFLAEVDNCDASGQYGNISIAFAAPYTEILLIGSKMRGNDDPVERLNAVSRLSLLENKLDPLGLPRNVSRLIRRNIVNGSSSDVKLDKVLREYAKKFSEEFT